MQQPITTVDEFRRFVVTLGGSEGDGNLAHVAAELPEQYISILTNQPPNFGGVVFEIKQPIPADLIGDAVIRSIAKRERE